MTFDQWLEHDKLPMGFNMRDLPRRAWDHQQLVIDELQYLLSLQEAKLYKLEQFVRDIATDYVELSHEKVLIQRNDYIRKAKELLNEVQH